MNREDIMRMAQKAGVRFYPSPWNEVELCSLDNLVRFHNLVASAEREACAQVCEDMDLRNRYTRPEYQQGLHSAVRAIRARGEA